MSELSLRDRIRRDLRRGGVVLAFLLLFLLIVIAFRGVVVPFLVAIFITYLVEPAIVRLARLKLGPVRLGRGGSIILIYLVLVGAITLSVAILLPRVSRQVTDLATRAPGMFQTVRNEWIPEVDAWLAELTGSDEAPGETAPDAAPQEASPAEEAAPPRNPAAPPEHPAAEPVAPAADPVPVEPAYGFEGEIDGKPVRGVLYPGGLPEAPRKEAPTLVTALDSFVEEAQTHFLDAVGIVTTVLRGVVGFVYSFILILMITAFLVVDRDKIVAFFHGLPPERYRARYLRAVEIVDRGLSGVIRGQILVCLINGFLTWIGLVILGVPYSLLLGAVATVFSLIPIFGTILSSIPIVAIAITQGLGYGLAALAWICVIHLVEANVINPRVIGGMAKLHPVIIVFALLAGEHAFGVVGALLAVPAASILVSMFRYARALSEEDAAAPVAAPDG